MPLILVLAAAGVLAALPPGDGVVLEEVVAVVRNPADGPPRPITLTKLREEARIALVGRGAVAAAWQPLDAAALRATLDWLVDQMLIADEATRLRLDEVARDEVQAELRRFKGRFAGPDEYARFLAEAELAEEELLVALARTVRVQRYLESRIGRWARVGDDEVQRYVEEHGAAGASQAAREAVRGHLAEEKIAAEVKELVAELRSRASVRVLDPRMGEGG